MDIFEQDFKRAIENLQEERQLQGKRPYDVHYTTVGADPEVLVKARLQGGSSGRSVEVYLKAKGYKVIIPKTDIEKTFKKSELNGVIDYIKDLLETPLTNQ
jgi:hypothetical protein